MCELFGLSSKKDIYLNEYLKTFYSHSDIHCNGWGMVLFDKEPFHITKEPVKASDSEYLKSIMGKDIINIHNFDSRLFYLWKIYKHKRV